MNIAIAVAPMSVRVSWAFLILGLRNAGTPFEIASIPVSAEQPDANARSTRRMSAAFVVSFRCSIGVTSKPAEKAVSSCPISNLMKPVPIITNTEVMNR